MVEPQLKLCKYRNIWVRNLFYLGYYHSSRTSEASCSLTLIYSLKRGYAVSRTSPFSFQKLTDITNQKKKWFATPSGAVPWGFFQIFKIHTVKESSGVGAEPRFIMNSEVFQFKQPNLFGHRNQTFVNWIKIRFLRSKHFGVQNESNWRLRFALNYFNRLRLVIAFESIYELTVSTYLQYENRILSLTLYSAGGRHGCPMLCKSIQ